MLVLSVTVAVLALCAIMGLVRGFTRMISGLLSFVLSFILVSAMLPVVTTFLKEQTPVYTFIQERCTDIGDVLVQSLISGQLSLSPGDSSGTGALSSGDASIGSGAGTDGTYQDLPAAIAGGNGVTIDRSKAKALLESYGYDGSVVDTLSDEELEAYAQQFLGAYAGDLLLDGLLLIRIPGSISFYEPAFLLESMNSGLSDPLGSSNIFSSLANGMNRVDQTKFIDSLPVPELMKQQLQALNNSEGYARLGVEDFSSYITGYFANLILNLLAFLLTLLVSWIIIRSIILALGLFSDLPILHTGDRLLGLALGLAQGILIIWVLFLVLSLFSATQTGQELMAQIYKSPFLELLYNTNIFLKSSTAAMQSLF